jgi:hypothetical protein
MPVRENYSLRKLDFTYNLFLFADAVAALLFANDLWGIMMGSTLGVAGLGALIVAILRGFWCWRHRPLLLLSLCPMVIAAAVAFGIWADGFTGKGTRVRAISDIACVAIPVVFAATMIIVPVWWVAKGRRSYLRSHPQ